MTSSYVFKVLVQTSFFFCVSIHIQSSFLFSNSGLMNGIGFMVWCMHASIISYFVFHGLLYLFADYLVGSLLEMIDR